MISFPNAKVNIGLYITEKRSDGFHSIETVFLPIPSLCDILEVLPKKGIGNSRIGFSQSGLNIDSDINENLCVYAYSKLSHIIGLPNITMHLHKQIPIGAGLGGGSANGAFALDMLNRLAENPLDIESLTGVALNLGSDCPFFLKNTPCFATGRGEELESVNLNLNGYCIMLVNPGVSVSTGKAYSLCRPKSSPINLKQTIETNVNNWKGVVTNDFEDIVFAMHPEVGAIKAKLYSMGAIYASMSGSGSTVFGIFKEKPNEEDYFKKMFTHCSYL